MAADHRAPHGEGSRRSALSQAVPIRQSIQMAQKEPCFSYRCGREGVGESGCSCGPDCLELPTDCLRSPGLTALNAAIDRVIARLTPQELMLPIAGEEKAPTAADKGAAGARNRARPGEGGSRGGITPCADSDVDVAKASRRKWRDWISAELGEGVNILPTSRPARSPSASSSSPKG